MPLVSLMTDFGIKDGNVGVMKGVIWNICPEAKIADLSHMIAPQNIREAALILGRSASYFPDGTVHLVVVDPGVGTVRRPIAAKIGSQYYVGPDNGTITVWLGFAEKSGLKCEFVHLDKPEFWLSQISHVFHGRDIFSPVAAHLAAGVPFEELGSQIGNPVRLELPRATKTSKGWRGEIIHIDHFGSLASNILLEDLGELLKKKENLRVQLAGLEIQGLVNTFGDRKPGELIALMGSTGNLIVSVVNGSAVAQIKAKVGDQIEVIMDEK